MSSPPLPDQDVLGRLPSARFHKRRRRRVSRSAPKFDAMPWREIAITLAGAGIAVLVLAFALRAII